jgi:hypothetical protein
MFDFCYIFNDKNYLEFQLFHIHNVFLISLTNNIAIHPYAFNYYAFRLCVVTHY